MDDRSDHQPAIGYEPLVDQNNAGIYEIQGDEFSYVNRRFAEIFGYTRDELIGKSPFSVIADRDHRALQENLEGLAQGTVDNVTAEHVGERKDGEEVVVKAHGTRVNRGSEAVYVGFVEDVTERKQREERFKAIFNHTFQFTGLLEPDGTILEANDSALYFGGLNREDVIGKPPWETYWFQSSAETREAAKQGVNQARKGHQFRDEIRVQGEDQDLVIDFSVRPITDERGDVTLLVAEGRDITDRKERERERERIITRVTDAVVEVDEDWNFTLVDDRAEEIYQMDEDELLGVNFWDVFSGALGTRFEEVYRGVMETREPASLEEYYTDLQGWFHVEVYPKEGGGVAFYFQDITERKRREERTAGLNDVLSECIEAESKQQVCDVLTENPRKRLHLPIVVIGLFDDEEGLRPVAQSKPARAHLDEEKVFDDDDGTAWSVFTAGEPTVVEDISPEILNLEPIDELSIHPLGRNGVLVLGSPDLDHGFCRNVAEDVRLIFDRIDREKRLRDRDELLEEQNESLNRLNRINNVIRSIDQELVNASTRATIEQAVCEHLTGGDTYTFAWIGDYDSATDRIEPREWAGHQQGYLEAVSFTADSKQSKREPTGTMVQSREISVIDELLDEPPHEPWQKAALKRGYRSVIAVPLRYEDSLYGTLTVYSDQSDVVDEMERQVLTELGETVGHAINAVESKRALVGDRVVTLELQVNDTDHPLAEFVRQGEDRRFEFESIMPSEDGMYRAFYVVHNASPEEYLEYADQTIAVRDSQLITEHDDWTLFESVLTEESLLFWLIDRGVVPRSFEITRNSQRLRVDLSSDVDIREFFEIFKAEYPDAELIASRERQREHRTRREFDAQLEERLTARQREILQMAYFSGYFETPRKRTGKEIADSLGISAPTFSSHVRAGLRNLFELVYDDVYV